MKDTKEFKLEKEIMEMFPKDKISAESLDYSIIEKRKPEWNMLSQVAQSAVFVFDCYSHKFVYASELGLDIFGLSVEDFLNEGHSPVGSIIHPDDIYLLLVTRKKVYDFLHSLSTERVKEYKLVHEFRIKNISGRYVRITEQEQVIELDGEGNIWLTLSVMNIDAGNEKEPVKSHIYNIATGEQIFIDLSDTLDEPLTAREIEILKLIHEGLLSKEISDKLGISINTVNNHRRNIFNKLNVDNAIEAVNVGEKLGLLG